VIWGGVDPVRFSPRDEPRSDETLFVGRLLLHKGVNYLVDAMPEDAPLRVVGRAYDERFLELVKARAAGKRVIFETSASDEDLVERYRRALVTVLPRSTMRLTDITHGSRSCSAWWVLSPWRAARRDRDACRVAPSSSSRTARPASWSLRTIRRRCARRSKRSVATGARRGDGPAARAAVLERFTWPAVARRCLQAYGGRAASAMAPAAQTWRS
jgi:hypothetical protein